MMDWIGPNVNYGVAAPREAERKRRGAMQYEMIIDIDAKLALIQYRTVQLPSRMGREAPNAVRFGKCSEWSRPPVPIRARLSFWSYGQNGRLIPIGDWQVVRSSPRPKLGSRITASHHQPVLFGCAVSVMSAIVAVFFCWWWS